MIYFHVWSDFSLRRIFNESCLQCRGVPDLDKMFFFFSKFDIKLIKSRDIITLNMCGIILDTFIEFLRTKFNENCKRGILNLDSFI